MFFFFNLGSYSYLGDLRIIKLFSRFSHLHSFTFPFVGLAISFQFGQAFSLLQSNVVISLNAPCVCYNCSLLLEWPLIFLFCVMSLSRRFAILHKNVLLNFSLLTEWPRASSWSIRSFCVSSRTVLWVKDMLACELVIPRLVLIFIVDTFILIGVWKRR